MGGRAAGVRAISGDVATLGRDRIYGDLRQGPDRGRSSSEERAISRDQVRALTGSTTGWSSSEERAISRDRATLGTDPTYGDLRQGPDRGWSSSERASDQSRPW